MYRGAGRVRNRVIAHVGANGRSPYVRYITIKSPNDDMAMNHCTLYLFLESK